VFDVNYLSLFSEWIPQLILFECAFTAVTVEYLADHRELIPAVARWYHMEWGHLRPGETVEDRAARVEQACGHCEIPTVFVSLADDELLGAASLIEHDVSTRPDLSPWLAGVFVAPEKRRRGVGTALVKRVLQEARALRIPRLYLYTTGSGALYFKLGWSVVERTLYRELWGDQEITIMELAADAL
jgi:N-acetylglutamate synthase-like GNAT family acetyltransferase